LEYALLPNWSVKVEYNYLDFGIKRQTITTNLAGVTLGFDQDIDHSLHIVKAGINYKFGGGYR
jgi:outer membrane immunogenic protein